MNMSRISVVAIVGFVVLASIAAVHATPGLSVRTLKGVYGFSGAGTLGGGTVPAAVVGLNSFDRLGGCEVTAKVNARGQVYALTSASCGYTVDPDGTGTIDITFNEPEFPVPFHSDFVIVDGGRELHFVLSDLVHSTVANGVAKKQLVD
jgi:hypothetical protein